MACIYLDRYIQREVYNGRAICLRNHCRAEPPRDPQPPGLVTTVGWGYRTSAPDAAADRVEAPASPARGRLRGIHGGCPAPFLPAEAGIAAGGGCLAGSIPPVVVRSRRCSRTPPRSHGAVRTSEAEVKAHTTRCKPAHETRRGKMKYTRGRPPGRGSERTEKSGRSFSSGSCVMHRTGSGRQSPTRRTCASGLPLKPMGTSAQLAPR